MNKLQYHQKAIILLEAINFFEKRMQMTHSHIKACDRVLPELADKYQRDLSRYATYIKRIEVKYDELTTNYNGK